MTKKFKNFCLNAFYVAIILATIFSLYSKFYVIENLDVITAQAFDETVIPVAEEETSTILIFFQEFIEFLLTPIRLLMKLFTLGGAEEAAEVAVIA